MATMLQIEDLVRKCMSRLTHALSSRELPYISNPKAWTVWVWRYTRT